METIKLSEKMNVEQSNKEMDSSILKLQMVQDFDEIIGISQLNEVETANFLKTQNLQSMKIFINDDPVLSRTYDKFKRFEMVINNLKVEEFRRDPSFVTLLLRGFGLLGKFLIFFVLIYGGIQLLIGLRLEARFNHQIMLKML
jgi:hypothetical protein